MRKYTMTILFSILLCTVAHAQQSASVDVMFGGTHGLGYKNPIVGGGLAVTKSVNRFTFRGDFQFARAAKISPGDGKRVAGEGLLRWSSGRYFIEGGGEVGYLSTTTFTKTGTRFVVGGGYVDKGVAVSGAYLGPDGTENKTQGARVRVEYVKAVSEQYGFHFQVEIRAVRGLTPYSPQPYRYTVGSETLMRVGLARLFKGK